MMEGERNGRSGGSCVVGHEEVRGVQKSKVKGAKMEGDRRRGERQTRR